MNYLKIKKDRREKMKRDDFKDKNFLPIGDEGPGEDGFFDGFDVEDCVTLLEDFCEGFSHNQKVNFLKEQGFNIINRKNKSTGDTFDVAYLPEDAPSKSRKNRLPAESNIDEKFVEKVGDCILKILGKYGK